jgi:hypothetical protein
MPRPLLPILRLKQAFAGLLALVVVLTNMQMAVGRAQAAAVDRVVICSGYGVMTIDLDADGNPVGPVHLCPDCLAAQGLALGPAPAVAPAPVLRLVAVVPALPHTTNPQHPGPYLPQARAPPVLPFDI